MNIVADEVIRRVKSANGDLQAAAELAANHIFGLEKQVAQLQRQNAELADANNKLCDEVFALERELEAVKQCA